MCVAIVAAPGTALAAQQTGCPSDSSAWRLGTVEDVADGFFPHLFPDQWATPDEFESDFVAPLDRNEDGLVCARVQVYDFNPKSHWYKLGLEILGEPTQFLTVKDNSGNAN